MKISKFAVVAVPLLTLALIAGCFFIFRQGKTVQDDNIGLEAKIENSTVATSTPQEIVVKAGDDVIEAPITVLAFGDLLLDRYIKREIDRKGADYTFKNIKEFLTGNDLVLANLEGSFTDYKPRKLDPNNTSFTFDPKLVSVLAENKFNILNLANNHVQDFGKDGFKQSQAYLDSAGISHFGDFYNEGPAVIKEIRGIKIAFIGYNEFGDPSTKSTIKKIKENASQVDYTVVYTHWGAEYQTDFWPGCQEKGRQFIDAGADIVLGSHPHVVQPIEIYEGKPIFYSLGNFVFDQIFSPEVRHGLAVRMVFAKDGVEFSIDSTEMKNFQVNLASEEKNAEVLSWLAKKSIASEDVKSQIKTGKFIVEL